VFGIQVSGGKLI